MRRLGTHLVLSIYWYPRQTMMSGLLYELTYLFLGSMWWWMPNSLRQSLQHVTIDLWNQNGPPPVLDVKIWKPSELSEAPQLQEMDWVMDGIDASNLRCSAKRHSQASSASPVMKVQHQPMLQCLNPGENSIKLCLWLYGNQLYVDKIRTENRCWSLWPDLDKDYKVMLELTSS